MFNLIFIKLAGDVWLEVEQTTNKIIALLLEWVASPLVLNLARQTQLLDDITAELGKLPGNVFLRILATGFVIPPEWNSHVIKLDDAFYLFVGEIQDALLSLQIGTNTERAGLWAANYNGWIARVKSALIRVEAAATLGGGRILGIIKFFGGTAAQQIQLLYRILTTVANGVIVFAQVAFIYTLFVGLRKDKWMKETLSQKHKRKRLKNVNWRKRI